MKLAGVILRDAIRATDKVFTYLVPSDYEEIIVPGSYVKVPFGKGNKTQIALCFEVKEAEEQVKGLKTIAEVLDDEPVMTEEQIALIKPIASRFNCTMGDAVSLMVPSVVGRHKKPTADFCFISDEIRAQQVLEENSLRSVAHIRLIEYLLENGKTEKRLLLLNVGASAAQLKAVIDKGLISKVEEVYDEDLIPKNEEAVPVASKFKEVHELNDEQGKALKRIVDDGKKSEVFLLHGITGSGKTEVYLSVAKRILEQGGSVLYMVPEISLTPQTIAWIKGRLGDNVAVLHSKLTDKERYEQWSMIRSGKAQVVVGPRSGIFAPIKNLSLIIIDEEHDNSYKSESHPRYSTKDIAFMRAKLSGAKVILGSATPSVESYYAASNGYFTLVELTKRAASDSGLPVVYPVDMKEQVKLGAGDILSMPLRNAMTKAFSENKQAILFLNRRGYSRTLVCNDCGSSCSCKYCSVPMTLHNNRRSGERLLICHYCGRTIPESLAECKECGGLHFSKVGFGTQQLEELLKDAFPGQEVLRMDQDTTAQAGAHKDIIEKFGNGEASILIGTQMIAKGHDFKNVTVVGILGADLMLASSGYKASERAFQLITQAAGRAGRGELPGEVYIQSYKPDDPLFLFAASQNYHEFYKSEIKYREKMNLPPFKALGEIMVQSDNEDDVLRRSEILKKYLSDFLSVQDKKYAFELMGPVPAFVYELRGKFRYTITIKAANKSALNAVFKQVAKDFDGKGYFLSYDNDATG